MISLFSSLREKATSGFLIYSAVMAIILSIVAVLPLYPNDFFPYLRIGQEIVKTGHIPTTEFMTFTQFGSPAIYLYWLPSLIFLGIFRLGGVTLTAILSLFCIGSFFTFLWLCLRELKIGVLITALILISLGIINFDSFLTRPQLLCYPLFCFALLLGIRWQNGNNRYLWFLPVITLFWVNFHASFIAIFILLIPAIIFGKGNRKKLLIFTVISLLATFINYYGFDLWKNMLAMLNNQSIKQFSVEWQTPINRGWQANIFFGTLLVIPVLTALGKAKIQNIYWIWFLAFGWMALSSIRYMIWFLPIEAIILSMLIHPLMEKTNNQTKRFQNSTLNLVIGVFLLLFPVLLLPGIRNIWWQKSPALYSEMTPVDATTWLSQNPQLPDNLWSDFTFSTYLTYSLPQRRVFMTNRFEDFPMDQLEDNSHLVNGKYNWSEVTEKYNINLVMASIQQQPDLILALSSSADWVKVYRDEKTVIFSRGMP